jgi:hypothetical protein
LVDSEGDEFPLAKVRRMMIKMFYEFKEGRKNNSMNPKRAWIKNLRRHRNN